MGRLSMALSWGLACCCLPVRSAAAPDALGSMSTHASAFQMSRVVVYLGEGLQGKLREDLMSDDFSSNWVEISVPGQSMKIPYIMITNG